MSESEFIFETSGYEFGKAAEEFVGKNTRRVAVAPLRLDGIAADALPAGEIEALVVVGNRGPNDMAHHIGLTATGCARAMPTEKFER